MERCSWCSDDEDYQRYHDEEWGVPIYDDAGLFEMLILEGAQAGLSWITILRKRDGYCKAFSNWDHEKVALYGEEDFERLMGNEGIVRHRLKILSAVNNAKRFCEVVDEFGSFSDYIWGFAREREIRDRNLEIRGEDGKMPVSSELSDLISGDLKKRGFSFVGTRIVYAFLQAVGIVCGHEAGCAKFKEF